MLSIDLPERAYCADVDYPMAVVGTAGRGIIIYQLDGQPKVEYNFSSHLLEYSNLKYLISLFRSTRKWSHLSSINTDVSQSSETKSQHQQDLLLAVWRAELQFSMLTQQIQRIISPSNVTEVMVLLMVSR